MMDRDGPRWNSGRSQVDRIAWDCLQAPPPSADAWVGTFGDMERNASRKRHFRPVFRANVKEGGPRKRKGEMWHFEPTQRATSCLLACWFLARGAPRRFSGIILLVRACEIAHCTVDPVRPTVRARGSLKKAVIRIDNLVATAALRSRFWSRSPTLYKSAASRRQSQLVRNAGPKLRKATK